LLLKTDVGSRRGRQDSCPIRTYNDPRRRFDPHDDPSATRSDRAVLDQRGLPKSPTQCGPEPSVKSLLTVAFGGAKSIGVSKYNAGKPGSLRLCEKDQ
jgi:hypothetical protein